MWLLHATGVKALVKHQSGWAKNKSSCLMAEPPYKVCTKWLIVTNVKVLVSLKKDVAVIGQVAKDNEQARRDEKARIKQEKYEAWAKKVAEREYNYALICWANDIKRYAKKI